MIEEYKDSPLGNVPVDWEVVKLEQVCLPKEGMRRGPFGGAIKKEFFVEQGYQVYEQRNAIYDDFVSARYFIDEEKYEELKAFQIQENDFIISCSGTIGKIAKVPKNYSKGVINQALLRLRLDREKMYDDYFIQQFRDVPFQNKITDSVQGGAMKNLVGMSEFRKTLVTLPPLSEQQKIAEILSTVDDKIEVIDQQIIETQELKKGLMQRLLSKGIGHTEFKESPLGIIPKSWEVVKFEDILRQGKGSLGYGILQPGEGVAQGINMVRTVDLTEVGRANTKILKVPENISNTSPTTVLEGGEVLLSVMGTLGRTFVVPNEWRGWNVNRALAVIRTNEKIDNNFLCHFFRSPYFKRVIDKQSLGSAQMRINLNDLRKYDIPLPSICEQINISTNLSLFDGKLGVLSEKKTHYQELKQGLMQQLLTGKIRVKV